MSDPTQVDACLDCLRRTWLLGRLAGHLDLRRGRIWETLALGDADLIGAVGGSQKQEIHSEWARFGPGQADTALATARTCGLDLICRCSAAYPDPLRQLDAPPAVLHIAGGGERFVELAQRQPVAIVGSRRASSYARGVTRQLARGATAAGLTVVSGMAQGIDAEAHGGALEGGGATVAFLPGPAERAVPAGLAGLRRQIVERGAAVSEIPPRTGVRSWMYLARNRLIAALAELTVVVEAGVGSGALLTARAAVELGRPVGVVPGQVTNPRAAGSNELLRGPARLIRDIQDALDEIYGLGAVVAPADTRPAPTAAQATLLSAIAQGLDTVGALTGAGVGGDGCLAEIAGLELCGRVRRGPGGRLTVIG